MSNKPIKNKFYTEHDDGSITFNGNLIVSDTPRIDAAELSRLVDTCLKLRRENAALRKTIDAQADYQRELRADRDRLDWLARNRSVSATERPLAVTPESLRDAIDAAMGEAQP